MAVIKLNRTKTGAVPTSLADGELYIDQLNNVIYWANATGSIQSFPLSGSKIAGSAVTTNALANSAVTFVKMAAAAIATKAEFIANTANKLMSAQTIWDAAAFVTIPYASTVTLDLNTVINALVTDTASFTLGNPTNVKSGQAGSIILNGAGTRTLTLGAAWKTPGSVRTVDLTGVCRVDYIAFSDTHIHCHVTRNLG